jgi:hypothetical protein
LRRSLRDRLAFSWLGLTRWRHMASPRATQDLDVWVVLGEDLRQRADKARQDILAFERVLLPEKRQASILMKTA